jgi:hypothetical protein
VEAECQENEDLVGNPPPCKLGRMYYVQNVNTGIGSWFLDSVHLIILRTEDKSAQTGSVSVIRWKGVGNLLIWFCRVPRNFPTKIRSSERSTRWRCWLWRYATSRKVASSIPYGVTGIFYWYSPSGRTMTLGSTRSLKDMSNVQGNAIPITGLDRPCGFQKFETLRFQDNWHTKVVSLWTLRTGRKEYVSEKFQWHHGESNPRPSGFVAQCTAPPRVPTNEY